MERVVCRDRDEMGSRAAGEGVTVLRAALQARGAAAIVLATGTSQYEMLAELVRAPGIDWRQVTGFHLDEYVGLPASHPASFRRYLKERFVDRLPAPLRAFHYINGEGDPAAECRRLGGLIQGQAIDVAFVGIGENGHLAFNDPPADFTTEEAYLVVELDQRCRMQQVGEGWFASVEEVPARAISMSIRQILKAAHIICSVPDARKAEAVRSTVERPVTPQVPASVLQQHPRTTLYLDSESAALLNG